jgi:transcription initiation factor IIE alpha subunit
MSTGVIRKKLRDDEVINMLKRGPLTTKQIAIRTGRSVNAVYEILGIIHKRGIIEHEVREDLDTGRKTGFWRLRK